MKRFATLIVALCASIAMATAQNYIVVDSEKVFKAIPEYTSALTSLEATATQYQKSVDQKFADVEKQYNNYTAIRGTLTAGNQKQYEDQILKAEADAVKYQESIFSNEGELFKKRLEVIAPIQKRVFAAIEEYSSAQGFDLVLDMASNPTILYKSATVDHTQQIIDYINRK